MDALTFLIGLTIGIVALNALGYCTARANAYLQRSDRASPIAEIRAQTLSATTLKPLPPVPVDRTAGHWWHDLLTPAGIFGCVAVLCEGPILAVNSFLIASTLEIIFDRPGNPIIPVVLFGWEREITDFDLIGALLSVMQMLTASALHLAWERRQRLWMIFGLALIVLPSLVAFEAGAAVYRALTIDGHVWNAVLSGLKALGIAGAECIVGIFAIDCFLVPLTLALLWSIATPVRAVARWWCTRQGRRVPLACALAHPFAALDHAVMVPLRRFDRMIGALMPGKTRRHEGEDHHATPSMATVHPNGLHAHAGPAPTGMRGDERRQFQASDALDPRVGHYDLSAERPLPGHAQ